MSSETPLLSDLSHDSWRVREEILTLTMLALLSFAQQRLDLDVVLDAVTPLLDPSTALTQQWTVLQFFSSEHSVVFETEALRTATPRIQEQHKLPSWTSLAVRDER